MKQIKHVRFLLSDLIKAVQVAAKLEKVPTVSEALTYYWNLITSRKWVLIGVTNQMDPNSTMLCLERAPQLEMRNEEFWNVILIGEDTLGDCDLVAETKVSRKAVVMDDIMACFKDHGWEFIAAEDEFRKEGFLPISLNTVEYLAETFIQPDEIVRALETQYRRDP